MNGLAGRMEKVHVFRRMNNRKNDAGRAMLTGKP